MIAIYQALVFKLSHRALDLKVLTLILPKHLGTKGNCLTDLLAPGQILLGFDQYEDFILALYHSINYILYNGEEHQYRVFSWSIGYNPKKEITLAVVWISLPDLSPNLFAKKSMLSIASKVGKPISIDKATQIKSKPNTSRVKVILNLMEKFSNRIRLQFVDVKYATFKCTNDNEKYQGDAREILIEKRRVVDDDQSKATALDRQLVVATSEQNCADSMNVDTCNIGLQTTTGNKDAENSGQHILQVENENATKNWTLVAHKNVTSSRTLSLTSQNNSPCSGKAIGKDGTIMAPTLYLSKSEVAKIIKENRDVMLLEFNPVIKPLMVTLNVWTHKSLPVVFGVACKLIPEAPIFIPKCVIAQKNKSRVLASNTIDLGEDSLDEDEE
ncbi:hypothetical protein H5410_006862 [Solanum commersonii]|uniref:DUF4283 domain-containing protein n=1 Tax=Solanum commersonii TaxID=4109 RepID=A0A9J6ABF0_SOLCO|nr:hypothetical protein H5410_006862 [Solanum commersonii]